MCRAGGPPGQVWEPLVLTHWSQTQFLEGHSSAQFCSNPNQTHLIQLIKPSGLLETSDGEMKLHEALSGFTKGLILLGGFICSQYPLGGQRV